MVSLLGSASDTLVKGVGKDSKILTVGDLDKNTKILMIYFSMHTCPPCREFTPLLIELYHEYNQSATQFEVVYMSCDKNEEQYHEYYAEMPWLALPF